ncbi:hypothetical protein MRX96_010461 [Rhipicephalus microplus]
MAPKPHPACIDDYYNDSWLGPQWLPAKVFEPAVEKTMSSSKVALFSLHRDGTTTHTPGGDFDGADFDCDQPEAYVQYLFFETEMKTDVVQEVIPANATPTGGSLKRPSTVASTDDIGIKDEPTKHKTPRLEVQNFGTTGPTNVYEVSATCQAHPATDIEMEDTGV